MPTWAIPILVNLFIKLLGATVLDKPCLMHLYERAKSDKNRLEVGTVIAIAKTLGVELPEEVPVKPVV